MADEIAQACQLEIEEVKMVVKGSVEVAAFLARLFKALLKGDTLLQEKGREIPGRHSLKAIMKMSEGTPTVLQIPENHLDEILAQAKKRGLHYANMIDFVPNDGKKPISVPHQESTLWEEIVDAYTKIDKYDDEEAQKAFEQKAAEEEEKLRNMPQENEMYGKSEGSRTDGQPYAEEYSTEGSRASSREDNQEEGKWTFSANKKIETKVENYQQAALEAGKCADAAGKDSQMDIVQYLRVYAKDTYFGEYPEAAAAELEAGVEPGKKMSATELFQPIRYKGSIPDGTVMYFYAPDFGINVTRRFYTDKETGLLYSVYSLKSFDGEIYQFTDHNMTNDEWNKEFLTQLLDKAQMMEGTPCRVFDSQEKLIAYKTKHGQIEPPEIKELQQKLEKGEAVFSSAESKREVLNTVSEMEKGRASAKVDESLVSFQISRDVQPVVKNGKFIVPLEEGQVVMLSRFDYLTVDEKGSATVTLKKDDDVILAKSWREEDLQTRKHITGKECAEIVSRNGDFRNESTTRDSFQNFQNQAYR